MKPKMYAWGVLLALSVADGLLTQSLIQRGGVMEFNPLIRFAMSWSGGMWITKTLCLAVVAAFLARITLTVLVIVCCCMSSVVLWNTMQLTG